MGTSGEGEGGGGEGEGNGTTKRAEADAPLHSLTALVSPLPRPCSTKMNLHRSSSTFSRARPLTTTCEDDNNIVVLHEEAVVEFLIPASGSAL